MAIENYTTEISLPIYPGLTEDQIFYIYSSVCNAYDTIITHEKTI